ncbi:NAD(P)H-binding protein [Zhihengliuella halotolerans]|uniref:Putative NADH-flavin reductase n=1 Tax=Zhihengliuella halotolerans TaxID=370736 RepID=A0A4Q8AH16_9MICC|nr:NAD(P)H-binding protein [Zhihengliuella halotolerans]RZU63687.1 putative NADH-flavin reductase [Zhihengliuella halotolerans]
MRIGIVGAAGGVGRRLARKLTDHGDEVTGFFRRIEQEEVVVASGAKPVRYDLVADGPEVLASALRGHDAVVFAAGAHGTGADQTSLIDGKGVESAIVAADSAMVPRMILISAMPESGRGREISESFEHYLTVKKEADQTLASSGLDWVIVRPGRLTDDDGNGRVRSGLAVPYGQIQRDDVAAFILEILHEPRLTRHIVEVVDGPSTVHEAVDTLVGLYGTPHL